MQYQLKDMIDIIRNDKILVRNERKRLYQLMEDLPACKDYGAYWFHESTGYYFESMQTEVINSLNKYGRVMNALDATEKRLKLRDQSSLATGYDFEILRSIYKLRDSAYSKVLEIERKIDIQFDIIGEFYMELTRLEDNLEAVVKKSAKTGLKISYEYIGYFGDN